MADDQLAVAFFDAARQQLRASTDKIVNCLNQLTDEQIWWRPTKSQNSVGVLVVHLCGNIRQWILSGVGGEEDVRDRPSEFVDKVETSGGELLQALNECVEKAGNTLAAVESSQALAPRRIQGYDTTRLAATLDTVAHFQGHAQEIISLTRQQLAEGYQFHWVPTTPEEMSARPHDS